MPKGAVLVPKLGDQEGNPVCCELWPGNATDVKSLLPVVERLRKRFGIGQVWIAADRGMISQETELEQDGKRFLLLLTEASGTCGKVFQAAGVAMPPTVPRVA